MDSTLGLCIKNMWKGLWGKCNQHKRVAEAWKYSQDHPATSSQLLSWATSSGTNAHKGHICACFRGVRYLPPLFHSCRQMDRQAEARHASLMLLQCTKTHKSLIGLHLKLILLYRLASSVHSDNGLIPCIPQPYLRQVKAVTLLS